MTDRLPYYNHKIIIIRKLFGLGGNSFKTVCYVVVDWHHFFVAIGLFSNSFEHSPLSKMIGQSDSPFITQLSWGALILIPILVVAFSLIGIHPLLSVTLLGQIMMGLHLPFIILALALGLNIGSVLSYMMSPFAGIVVVIANILGVSSATVSLRWNGKYCIKFLVLSLAFIIGYTLMVQ